MIKKRKLNKISIIILILVSLVIWLSSHFISKADSNNTRSALTLRYFSRFTWNDVKDLSFSENNNYSLLYCKCDITSNNRTKKCILFSW